MQAKLGAGFLTVALLYVLVGLLVPLLGLDATARTLLTASAYVVIGLGAAWILSSTIGRRLRSLAAAAGVISKGDLTRLVEARGNDETADLARSFSAMTDSLLNVVLEVHVQSPSWAEWDRIEIYSNAATVQAGSAFLYGATPDLVLEEGDCDPSTTDDGGDFDIEVVTDVGGVAGADRLEATISVPFSGLTEETWFVAVVRGSDGECAPMFPIYPDNLSRSTNTTLAELVDGNVSESGTMALGATNALYFVP